MSDASGTDTEETDPLVQLHNTESAHETARAGPHRPMSGLAPVPQTSSHQAATKTKDRLRKKHKSDHDSKRNENIMIEEEEDDLLDETKSFPRSKPILSDSDVDMDVASEHIVQSKHKLMDSSEDDTF